MADFRKWFLVLAAVALVTSPAFGQGVFNCDASQAVNNQVRAGGITERMGDVIMTCQGLGDASPSVTVNFLSTMPSNTVTNKIGTSTTQGFPTAAGLELKDVNGNINQVIQGFLQRQVPTDTASLRNVVMFPNVVVPRGTSGTFHIRIFNIRVVVPVGTAQGSTIGELVSTSNPVFVPVVNPFPTVATVNNPLLFAVTNCTGGSFSLPSFQQCVPQGHHVDFGVKFTEGFGVAFKDSSILTGESGESYTTLCLTTGCGTGTAVTDPANGTRLQVTFTNVPAGVSIAVTDHPTAVTTAPGELIMPDARFVNSGAVDPVGTSDCGISYEGGNTLYPASASGSTVTAQWEINTVTTDIESLTFGVDVYFTPALPTLPGLTGSTPATVTGTLAPVSTLLQADANAAIVRFQNLNIDGGSVLAIVPCVTNLLFPYVTTKQQYETGIAIANTTLDNPPFKTALQKGPCTLYFFGSQNNKVATIDPQVSDPIEAGQSLIFLMTSPSMGITADLNNFVGYMIARCNFQLAHGLAFIVDMNLPGFGSESYLALVIPDRGINTRPPDGVGFAPDGSGEQLAF
jgi:hypothetical protein